MKNAEPDEFFRACIRHFVDRLPKKKEMSLDNLLLSLKRCQTLCESLCRDIEQTREESPECGTSSSPICQNLEDYLPSDIIRLIEQYVTNLFQDKLYHLYVPERKMKKHKNDWTLFVVISRAWDEKKKRHWTLALHTTFIKVKHTGLRKMIGPFATNSERLAFAREIKKRFQSSFNDGRILKGSKNDVWNVFWKCCCFDLNSRQVSDLSHLNKIEKKLNEMRLFILVLFLV